LLGLKRVGSFRHQTWDGACRMTWSAQYSIALSLPPAHTPIIPSTTSRQPSQGIRFFCLPKRCYSGLPNSPPQPHSFKTSSTRDTRYFALDLQKSISRRRDTCKLRHDGHVCHRQTCPISLCLSLAVRPSCPNPCSHHSLSRQ
jgi:hypothetical protein